MAKDVKLPMVDFTAPGTLKDRTDGEIYCIIKNGHNDVPAEGPFITTAQGSGFSGLSPVTPEEEERRHETESEASRNKPYLEVSTSLPLGSRSLRLKQ